MKLISLNIEGDNHLNDVFTFLQREKPDIVCLQEVFLADFPSFEEKLEMRGYHLSLMTVLSQNEVRLSQKGEFGIAILSRFPLNNVSIRYYAKYAGELPVYSGGANVMNRAVLIADVEKDGEFFTIATTHFTWTPNGTVTELQLDDLDSLREILKLIGQFVLCGDFNAPRGKQVFDALAQEYVDNIPSSVTTTMDNKLHRNHNLDPLVVDGLFTTTNYSAKNTKVVCGVSDHCAIVSEITKQ